jgi:hypothetical protein
MVPRHSRQGPSGDVIGVRSLSDSVGTNASGATGTWRTCSRRSALERWRDEPLPIFSNAYGCGIDRLGSRHVDQQTGRALVPALRITTELRTVPARRNSLIRDATGAAVVSGPYTEDVWLLPFKTYSRLAEAGVSGQDLAMPNDGPP